MKASILTRREMGARRMEGSSFMATWVNPLAQRDCCTWKPCISTGSSEGQSRPGTYMKRQPLTARDS